MGGRAIAALTLSSVALAGCGSSGHHDAAARSLTVAKYGSFPADTISAQSRGDPRLCRADARSFADGAAGYVAHFGAAAATPADTYYMLLREQLADFDVRGCRTAVLSSALTGRLTEKERRTLVAKLPQPLSRRVGEALASPS